MSVWLVDIQCFPWEHENVYCVDWALGGGVSWQDCVRSCRYMDDRGCSEGMVRGPL